MNEIKHKPARKSTFRRLDKYLYVARTMGFDPARVIAVCVMSNSGRNWRSIACHLQTDGESVRAILEAAAPFLRKRRAAA